MRVQFACDWWPLGFNLYATGGQPDTICLRQATRRTLFLHFYPYESAPATYPPLWFSPSDVVFSVLVMTESLYVCRSEWCKILIKNKLGRKFFGKMPASVLPLTNKKIKGDNLIVVLYMWVNFSFSAKNYFRNSVLRRLVNLWLFGTVKPPYSGNIFTSTLCLTGQINVKPLNSVVEPKLFTGIPVLTLEKFWFRIRVHTTLKGQCHEIFCFWFFSNQFPPSPWVYH